MSDRPSTLCEAFQRTAATQPDAIAVRTPGDTHTLTWAEYSTQVRRVAAALAATGITRGDTVALMMANRPEFYPIEVGAQHVGATSFSVYNTAAANQLRYVLDNAGSRVVFCETDYVPALIASGAEIELIVTIDGESADGAITLGQFLTRGAQDYDFEAGWRAVRSEDVATLIYTSGTTGNPKGVESTHTNLLAEAIGFEAVMGIEFGDRVTSFMPSAHIADRFTALYLQEVFGTQITCVCDPKQIATALPDVRPTVWGAVPRVWEKLKAAIEFGVDNEPDPARREGLQWALSIASKRSVAELAGIPMSEELAAEWSRADELVLSKLRIKLGLDQVRWALSGAAPIPAETLGFFTGIGLPISEIWGMSELSCVASVSHPRDARLGTVGRLLPGMDARVADDGELLVRGPLVMKGYRKEPQKTSAAIDPGGWLHTGDIITIGSDGYLRVIDRKKELIINASGKNMSPANIENTIKAATPLIGMMAVIGDGQPYNTALIVLDAESAPAYAARRGLLYSGPESLIRDAQLVTEIAAGVARGNSRLSRVEQIKRFTLLPTFWEPGGEEVTLTMKLKRGPVTKRYREQIEAMYRAEPSRTVHRI